MKRMKIIMLMVITILMISSFNVYAAEPTLAISGENEVSVGSTKKLTLTLSSDTDEIGVISGTVTYNDNIESIQLAGQNSWQLLSYNNQNGQFKLVKAAGAKNEAAMEISYTVKSGATGKASVTVSDITLTTTDYATKTVANVTKEITISEVNPEPTTKVLSGISVTTKPNKVTYTAGQSFDKTGMVVTANYSDGTSKEVTSYTYSPNGELTTADTKITITYTEGNVSKIAEQEITVTKATTESTNNNGNTTTSDGNVTKTDTTVADKVISQTGITNYAVTAIVVIALVGVASYIKYKKYKEI